jgi:hypothetical protein
MIKDVAYNTGGAISGTTQVNNIAIATDDNPDYTEGSWVGGVDTSDGYVIVCDTTSAGLVGRTTGGGIVRMLEGRFDSSPRVTR